MLLCRFFHFKHMKTLKKIYAFLISMKFAIILLFLVALFCMLGSFVTQRNALPISAESEADVMAFYTKQYGERGGALIYSLGLDDVFHSWWFIALVTLLCLSVLLCNISRIRSLIRRTHDAARIEHALSETPTASVSGVSDPKPVLRRLHFFRPIETTVDGKEAVFAYRNRLGYWGAWVCHLGIVLIVLGYALGQMTLFNETVYGVPGDTLPIGDTSYTVTIDDFRIDRNEGGFIEQYTSSLTLRDANGKVQSGTASVNHPANLLGFKFYQHATGQVIRVTLYQYDTYTEPKTLLNTETDLAEVGTEISLQSIPDMVLTVDAIDSANGVYYTTRYVNGEVAPWQYDTVKPGEEISLAPFPYVLVLSEPVDTLLRVKKDSFSWLVLIGAILTALGLFFALYVVPETVWAMREADGSWTVFGKSKKLAPLFKEQFDRAVTGRKGKEAVK